MWLGLRLLLLGSLCDRLTFVEVEAETSEKKLAFYKIVGLTMRIPCQLHCLYVKLLKVNTTTGQEASLSLPPLTASQTLRR